MGVVEKKKLQFGTAMFWEGRVNLRQQRFGSSNVMIYKDKSVYFTRDATNCYGDGNSTEVECAC